MKIFVIAAISAIALIAGARPAGADDADTYKLFKNKKNVQLPGKFTFVRIEYFSEGGYGEAFYDYDGRRWQRWETDYPEADENFIFRIQELTTLEPNPRAITRRLTDEDLHEFPFIYMCDVGWQYFTDPETKRLREYLLSGGFLWADDFWGQAEWDNFEYNMRQVMPNAEWIDIPKDHPILTMVFSLDACPQIPARDFAEMGMKTDPPGIHRWPATGIEKVNFKGIFDDDGRLMAVATHNTDIGDGWEREAEDEWYFKTYSTKAYAIGVNVIVYALTH